MPKILEEIKRQLSGLPAAARKLVPDDYIPGMLCDQVERELAKDVNPNDCIAAISLLCRRLAILFNDLAVENEILLRDGGVR